jgi:hypothetical protein
MIQEARLKLIKEKILNPRAGTKPIQESSAYDTNTNDWRYLTAAHFI